MTDDTNYDTFEGWDIKAVAADFRARALPPHAGVYQQTAMMFAFWAGCAAVHTCLVNLQQSGKTRDEVKAAANVLADAINVGGEAVLNEREMRRAEVSVSDTPFPGMQDMKPGDTRLVKIDPETGEEMHASVEEQAKVLEIMRKALTTMDGRVEFSEKAMEQLKARGMTEDQIKVALADTLGVKQ